jgi:hypothetical protein
LKKKNDRVEKYLKQGQNMEKLRQSGRRKPGRCALPTPPL